MVDVTDQGDRIEERDDLGSGDAARYAYWTGQEAIAEKEESAWIKRGRKVVQRYRDERPTADEGSHKFNILWSNVQTLKPTLYARTPKPDVDRRFKDADPVGRLASTLLERALAYQLDAFDFDEVMKAVVEDRLLPGRGTARVLYIPHFGEPIEAENFEDEEASDIIVAGLGDEGESAPEEPARTVDYEEVQVSYVFWEDYREAPARTWKELPWIRYRSYLTRKELTDRFGKAKGDEVNLDYSPHVSPEQTKDDPPPDLYKKAIVHEYWDKIEGKVCWLAPGTPDLILDYLDDPLELPDFFPSPDPLLATHTNDKRIPVPDYTEYQDQANELDTLTARIDCLTKALRVAGVYPGDNKQELQQLLDGTGNQLIPVADWQRWMDGGGLTTFIQWLPIQQVAETLIQLYNARDRAKQTLYEITGIGDILRGQTNPVETLGAQELKANFSTRRIIPQQKDVARFSRDVIRLMAAVVAIHFSGKTLSLITGYPQLSPVPQLPPPPPQFLPAPQMAQAGPSQPPPPTGSVVPFQQPGGGQPGMLPAPPQPQPNPQYGQWLQMQHAVQAIQQQNAQLQKQFDDAVALIKSDGPYGFKLDIEADSTIAPDEDAEKQARTEFLGEMVPLLQQLLPMCIGNPPVAELAKQIALFGARGFRVARPLEESIEKAFDAAAQAQPPQPPPQQGGGGVDSPADLALRKHEIDTRAQTSVADAQSKAQAAAQANAIKAQSAAATLAMQQRKLEQDAELGRANLALKAQQLQDQQAYRAQRGQAFEARGAESLT